MAFVVAQAFNTVNRRFSVGEDVSADDIQGAMTLDDWVYAGFIMGADTYYHVLATIASGQSLSDAIPLARREIVAIVMPSAWTAADLTFRTSLDGGSTWSEFYSGTLGTPIAVTAGGGQMIQQDADRWKGIDTLQIRSGLSVSPVAQAAQRVITLVVRPAT